MSIVLGGQKIDVPGVRTISFLDDSRVPVAQYVGRRTMYPHMIVLHSTGPNTPTLVRPGSYEPPDLFHFARYVNAHGPLSWDATVLTNGTILWHNNPLVHATHHANQLNPHSLGIELEQGPQGALYEVQFQALVALLRTLTEHLQIRRQIPWYAGAPDHRKLVRFTPAGGSGANYNGIVGHRNSDSDRSDPGENIWLYLAAHGFAGRDLSAGEDLSNPALWSTPAAIPGTGGNSTTIAAALVLLAASALVWWGIKYKGSP
jgi:hypothetical protein